MTSETLFALAAIAAAAAAVALLAACAYLVVRDTRRQRGRWGINLAPSACRACGAPPPDVRPPPNARQFLWGGWTCPRCGVEVDKWGEPSP